MISLHQVTTTQLVYGIPYEWFEEVSEACDDFFRRRGMPIKGASLKEQIHAQAVVDKMRKARTSAS